MTTLETIFPIARLLRRIPLNRDQWMLLLMGVNLLFLGVDTLLAHSTSGTIRTYEWIPIIYSPIAGILVLAAGVVALRNRPLASAIGASVFLATILVGLMGTYFHLHRALQPGVMPGEQLSFLVWAPPVMGPLAFCLVGWLGISAIWEEAPVGSGRLRLLGGRTLRFPYSKTRAYFWLVGIGFLTCLVSSTIDHAHTGFRDPWLIIPLSAGVLGTVVPVVIGFIERPKRVDYLTYTVTMLVMILVGMVGAGLHVLDDLGGGGAVVVERFLRGAPLLAPMLYANFGMLGLIALLGPAEEAAEQPSAAVGDEAS
jgi:hypothetical protein